MDNGLRNTSTKGVMKEENKSIVVTTIKLSRYQRPRCYRCNLTLRGTPFARVHHNRIHHQGIK
jgi:hypothetical protein